MFVSNNKTGITITFANGWEVSAQWGQGTYSDGYYEGGSRCPNAEVAIFDNDDNFVRYAHHKDDVIGYVDPNDFVLMCVWAMSQEKRH